MQGVLNVVKVHQVSSCTGEELGMSDTRRVLQGVRALVAGSFADYDRLARSLQLGEALTAIIRLCSPPRPDVAEAQLAAVVRRVALCVRPASLLSRAALGCVHAATRLRATCKTAHTHLSNAH
jgi:hypothetical protein